MNGVIDAQLGTDLVVQTASNHFKRSGILIGMMKLCYRDPIRWYRHWNLPHQECDQ